MSNDIERVAEAIESAKQYTVRHNKSVECQFEIIERGNPEGGVIEAHFYQAQANSRCIFINTESKAKAALSAINTQQVETERDALRETLEKAKNDIFYFMVRNTNRDYNESYHLLGELKERFIRALNPTTKA